MDIRQQARDRFARLMRVPDIIVANVVMLMLAHPLFMAFDKATTGRVGTKAPEFQIWLVIAACVLIPTYFLLRAVVAAIISALAVRPRASPLGRPSEHLSALPQTHH